MHHRIFSTVPGLSPLDEASSVPHPNQCEGQKCLRTFLNVPIWSGKKKSLLVENHCQNSVALNKKLLSSVIILCIGWTQ